MRRFSLLLAGMLPTCAFAGGYQMNAQGAQAYSMGGAFTAVGHRASSVFYNPGAMTFAKKSTITIGGFFVKTNTNYLGLFNENVTAENPSLIPFHIYADYLLTDKIAIGIGMNSPFKSDFKWADDWEGRYVSQEFKLNTFYIQPSVSYQINENIGVGGGPVFGFGSINFNRALPVEGTAPFGEEVLKINGNGIGFNVGVFYKFNDEGRVGLNYRSAVKFDMKNGSATFSDIPASFAADYPASATFNTEIKMPSVISLGVSYNFTKKLLTTFQLDYTNWSSFDSLNYIFPDNPSLDIRTGRNSQSSFAARIGGQFSLTDELDVQLGGAYDLASVPQDHLSPEFPESDKISITAGAGYKINKMWSADITLGLENYFERKGQFSDANLSGSYKSSSIIIGVGLNYEF